MTRTSTTVVGVDGSDTSIAALRWAFEEAALTGASIEALLAWQWPVSLGTAIPIPSGFDPAADARQVLDEIVGPLSEEYPSVTIRARTVEGHPAETLVEASRHTDLVVVGCRGHGSFTGLLIGSVSQHCAAHAASPVLVYRPPSA